MALRSGQRSACAIALMLLTTFGASAEEGREAHALAERLKGFLELHHLHAAPDDPGKGYSVAIEDGVIAITVFSREVEECTPDEGRVKSVVIVDVRAIRRGAAGAFSRTFGFDERSPAYDTSTGVFLPYRSDVVGMLRAAADGDEAIIAEARAAHGWGVRAAIEASKVFSERYGTLLALRRDVSTYCSGEHSVNAYDWDHFVVPLKPAADPDEFLSIFRDYQETILVE